MSWIFSVSHRFFEPRFAFERNLLRNCSHHKWMCAPESILERLRRWSWRDWRWRRGTRRGGLGSRKNVAERLGRADVDNRGACEAVIVLRLLKLKKISLSLHFSLGVRTLQRYMYKVCFWKRTMNSTSHYGRTCRCCQQVTEERPKKT